MSYLALDLKDDVDDDGFSELLAHLCRDNGSVVKTTALLGNYHHVNRGRLASLS